MDETNDSLRFVVGTTLVSVCHALLSIRSLSATLHVDPAWLLNHAELSRVQWTKGGRDGDIFVELDAFSDADLPMIDISRTQTPDAKQLLGESFSGLSIRTGNY